MNENLQPYSGYRFEFDPQRTTVTGFEPEKSKYKLNIILFLATILTTLFAGCMWGNVDIFKNPLLLYRGWPFSLSLMLILTAHELGHYFTSRRYGLQASLPYFIPVPHPLLGTLGAFIKMKSRFSDRKALFDVGAAGPITGFIVSTGAIIVGLKLSTLVDVQELEGGTILFGESIFFTVLSRIVLGSIQEGYDILLHPIGLAGWFGLLVTVLNLIPIGQSDGGHIAYAVFGRKQETFSKVVFAGLLPVGIFVWLGWLIMGFLLVAMSRFRHPAPIDDATPLDLNRKILGVVMLFMLVVCFTPVPLQLG